MVKDKVAGGASDAALFQGRRGLFTTSGLCRSYSPSRRATRYTVSRPVLVKACLIPAGRGLYPRNSRFILTPMYQPIMLAAKLTNIAVVNPMKSPSHQPTQPTSVDVIKGIRRCIT